MRATGTRLRRRHGGSHAEPAGFVGSCRHDAARSGSTDDDWSSAKGWLVALFDGGVERIKVQVQD